MEVTPDHTGKRFAAFLRHLVLGKYKKAKKVILVSDNLNIHHLKYLKKICTVKQWNQLNEKIEWHYTPVHASWLNMAEIEIGVITKAVLNKRIPALSDLKYAVQSFQERRNELKAKINWQFTKENASCPGKPLRSVNLQKPLLIRTFPGDNLLTCYGTADRSWRLKFKLPRF